MFSFIHFLFIYRIFGTSGKIPKELGSRTVTGNLTRVTSEHFKMHNINLLYLLSFYTFIVMQYVFIHFITNKLRSDPLDVVEIGSSALATGSVTPVDLM